MMRVSPREEPWWTHRLGLVALGATVACTEPVEAAASHRPDLLLLVVDTLRADRLGLYGHDRPTSPNVDALARDGTWFRRAYAHSGWTLASMCSLLTGELPHRHGVGRDPAQPDRIGCLPEGATTLAEQLSDVGYRCGAVVNNTFLAPGFGLDQGFEHYDYQGATNELIRSGEESVERALAWLDAGDGRPSFLLLHMMEPHLNYDPPASVRGTFTGVGDPPVELPFTSEVHALQIGLRELAPDELEYVMALYDEEVLAVDRAVGALIAGLEARGRLAHTVIALTSDHGEEFYDHGSFEHGHTLYGELTRVPLVLSGPGLAHGEVTGLVQHLDLFEGLLRLGGASAPSVPGRLDLFEVARTGTAPPRYVVCENVLKGPPRTSITDGTHRLHIEQRGNVVELWRLDEDGIERERVGGASGTRRALRGELRRRRGGLGPATVAGAVHIPDFETFEELRALGYVR